MQKQQKEFITTEPTSLKAIELLYTFSVRMYGLALRLAAPFHEKARKWVRGRRNWEQQLRAQIDPAHPWIWFHCASLGEFEQGRNLIEQLRTRHSRFRILLTFFSPSGYEIRKNYAHAGYVCYLPLDTPAHARRFLDIVQPRLVVFVKYELWLHYLGEIAARQIPFALVAARVRPESAFFRSIFRSLYRRAFEKMTHIFTQDAASQTLIRDFSGNARITVSSDTRYDRVQSNRAGFEEIPAIRRFKGGRLCIIGGSTWPRDEELLLESYRQLKPHHNLCLILAPHEIHPERIDRWAARFPEETLRFSQIDRLSDAHRILWIDNIGMLSRLYHYADIACIGGAWGTGLHNILEAAVFGCPVIFGPDYKKFPEAAALIAAGGGFSIGSQQELAPLLEGLLSDGQRRAQIQRMNKTFIETRAGATEMIMAWCEKVLAGV